MATLFMLCTLAVTGFCSLCRNIGKALHNFCEGLRKKETKQPARATSVASAKIPAMVEEETKGADGTDNCDLLDFDEFCDIMDEGEN